MDPGLQMSMDMREAIRAFDVDALAELCAGFDWALQRGNPLAHLVKPSHAKLGVQLEMARVLIAGGCDVDLGQDGGEPPLWSAVRHNNVGLVEVLLSAGADADTACEFPCRALWSPLHTAAADGRAEVAALLVKAGATERPDFAGATPLHRLFVSGNNVLATLDALLVGSVDLTRVSRDDERLVGGTVLAETVRWAATSGVAVPLFVEIAERLIAAGAELDTRTAGGESLLHIASSRAEIVDALIGLGAHPEAEDKHGHRFDSADRPEPPPRVRLCAFVSQVPSAERLGDDLGYLIDGAPPNMPRGVLLTIDMGRVHETLAGIPAVFVELPMQGGTVDLRLRADRRYELAGEAAEDAGAFFASLGREKPTPFRQLRKIDAGEDGAGVPAGLREQKYESILIYHHGPRVPWVGSLRAVDHGVDGPEWRYVGTVTSEAYIGRVHAFYAAERALLRVIHDR